jgi:hypothetical protein
MQGDDAASEIEVFDASNPAACIIVLSVSWSGCMRIDSAR